MLSRRRFAGLTVAATAAATLSHNNTLSPAKAASGPQTIVLVHGAWHGGWCWRRVADLLEKKGHKVFCPTLTGLGERSHLIDAKTGLATHVTDVVNVIKWENLSGIVLVGHSYGGAVISGVAEQVQDKIASIVFLDAFVPENGDSLEAGASQPVKDAIAAAKGRGDISLKPVPAAVFRVNEKDRAWVDAMCTPQPIATLTEKSLITGARDKVAKKTYIRAKGYPSVPFDTFLAKFKTDAGWKTFEMACGHDAMVDSPGELAGLIEGAA
jgi:pimeloyl-ACP methyl ester carboxylesterase